MTGTSVWEWSTRPWIISDAVKSDQLNNQYTELPILGITMQAVLNRRLLWVGGKGGVGKTTLLELINCLGDYHARRCPGCLPTYKASMC